ncbi:MAG: hypothetical protein ACTH6A_06525 [Brachybacterium tyrofermentans]|uniref:hypothetical protein n=1 Tax=Brachybacterium tyrofermentans TaxID=47848 RepID=UPI003F919E7D
MSTAPMHLDPVPVTRHSADDDLLSIRIIVDDLIAPGDHYFNVTPSQASVLADVLDAVR